MSDPDRCPICTTDRIDGLCPRCMIRLGLDGPTLNGNGIGAPGATFELFPQPCGERAPETITLGDEPEASVRLRDLDTVEAPEAVAIPSSYESLSMTRRAGGVRLLGEIARGGMGSVLRGRDDDLGRDLAVKVLLERYKDRPELVRRFIEEAQIGGQLQHPGIVPIYELGTFTDHRPYIAMKLVTGCTLAKLLGGRPGPTHDLPRFLAIFEAICQTMAYAHARGVIHRDLKPSNVMVGSFGEVQVMDWGLAKVMPRGAAMDETTRGIESDSLAVQTVRSGSTDGDSHAGAVLGTPAYMAPEQARGEVDRIDERADVFSLGSILCELLTGHPAFDGGSGAESLRKAAAGELSGALDRLAACGAEAGLLALAVACLQAEPEVRPRDAREVASRVRAHLAGVQERLREAELARAEALARAAEERRRRRAEVGMVAALLALVLFGGGGWFVVDRIERNRLQRTATEVQTALDAANRLEGQARSGTNVVRWSEAVAVAERAEAVILAGGGSAALRASVKATLERLRAGYSKAQQRANADARDDRLVKQLEEARLRMAEMEGEIFNFEAKLAAYAAAFREYGVDVSVLPEAEAIAKLKDVAIREQVAAGLDDWSARAERLFGARLVRVADAIDPDPTRSKVRAVMARRDLPALEELARREDAENLPPATLARLGAALRDRGKPDVAAALLLRGRARHPDDFWINFVLAFAEQTSTPRRVEGAVRYYTAASALRPHNAAVHTNLGALLYNVGRTDEAITEYNAAIKLRPNFAMGHSNLSSALMTKGKFEDAIAHGRRAIELRPDYTAAHYNLAKAFRCADRPEEAAAEFRRAIELQPDFAEAHCELGFSLQEVGQFAAALVSVERGHELGTRRADWSYPSAEWVREARRRAELQSRLAMFLDGKDRPEDIGLHWIPLADSASKEGLHATAIRVWREVFAAAPQTAEDVRTDHRYWAIRVAALAGSGNAKDVPAGDEQARAQFRMQALEWLEADLVARGKLLNHGNAAERTRQVEVLEEWKTDPNLAGVRDSNRLTKLPEEERRRFIDLWSHVDIVLKSATKP
jgi:eukaryotic-like serine/threonine-protein kinase